MFKQYYEDELEFLRGMGREFAAAYPDIASELALAGRDPDVERLLQGFAFLTGRIRQSLDGEFPELLYPLLGQIWPHALRPTPCSVVIEFRPRANMFREPYVLKRGAMISSLPVEGTPCHFRTCHELTLLPLRLESVRTDAPSPGRAELRLVLRPLPGASTNRLGKGPLRLHLAGAPREVYGLYGWLGQDLLQVRLRAFSESDALLYDRLLPADALQPVGWRLEEAFLPYPPQVFAGYRHLHEYFCFPSKHLFFELKGLDGLAEVPPAAKLEVCFELRPLLRGPLQISADNLRLHCVPAVNLFAFPARPISADATHAEHPLRPESDHPEHFDIFSVERVTAHVRRQGEPVEYHPFFSFHRPRASALERPVLYQVHLRPPVCARGGAFEDTYAAYPAVETSLSFVDPLGEGVAPLSTVSADLLVTNRDLPLRLRPGEICVPSSDIPATVQLSDIGTVSVPAPAPVGGDGLWRFFSHLLLGLDSLRDKDALRCLLTLYHFPALFNLGARQKLELLLASFTDLSAEPEDQLLGRPPVVVRGTHVRLLLHDAKFAHFGEVALFGTALHHFLAETSAINTYTRLTLRGIDQGLELLWEPRAGNQALI